MYKYDRRVKKIQHRYEKRNEIWVFIILRRYRKEVSTVLTEPNPSSSLAKKEVDQVRSPAPLQKKEHLGGRDEKQFQGGFLLYESRERDGSRPKGGIIVHQTQKCLLIQSPISLCNIRVMCCNQRTAKHISNIWCWWVWTEL